ncbi:MAG: menaquinone biosynthesis protein [Gemmatimonadetes bacterium]|nr:menaquinone biosynthesis protein [Gemmatimonadota bacterium]
MKVAKIPYLNAEPFYAGWGEDPPFEVVEMVPRKLGQAARDGVIDAGLMAVADFFTVDGTFDLVTPSMGVAAAEHVRSVVLLSHRRPRELYGARIGITGESSTSKRLLELLATAYWEIEPTWVPEAEIEGEPRETVDALLLIGDRALAAVADPEREGWSRTVDLAAEWWTWQALPFVFAVWVVRSAVARRERERFSGFLTGSLAVGVERIPEIAASRADTLGDAETLRAYLGHFTYRLGALEREGLARFRDLLAEHDIQEYEDARV